MSLNKMVDLDHFIIEEKYEFWEWKKNSLISLPILNEWLRYFSILFPIYLTFLKLNKRKKSSFGLESLYLWAIQLFFHLIR